jgi:hypothetical protein
MAHDVFVSHSVKDNAVADAVVARLEAESVNCWIAPRDVVPGADWGESIIDAIESSRIMILIFSRNADASPQIKREVERAVNKGVYIIPFRVDDIPPTKSLEYFISTSQWMDAFSPPLERHLDNLAKTVKAVLNSPPLPAENVPAQPERPPIPTPTRPPSSRKSILIPVAIAILVILAAAGWYLIQKKKGPPEKPAITPPGSSTPVPITAAAVTPAPTLTPQSLPSSTPFPTLTTPPPSANLINDEDVRNFVTSFFRAEERGDVEYILSQYGDAFRWGPERRDKAFHRDQLNEFFKQWPILSYAVGDIRVVHSDIPDRVTAYLEYRYFYRNPALGRSDSGHFSNEWVISKKFGTLKIVSERWTRHPDSPAPSLLPTGSPTLTTPPPPPIANNPSITPAQGPWLFPDSSSRYLTPSDLTGLSADDLWRARNEIFARNGYKFSSPRGIAFAQTLGHYYRGVDDNQDRVFNSMNKYERANVKLIQSLESGR